jgi:hypothetical protein
MEPMASSPFFAMGAMMILRSSWCTQTTAAGQERFHDPEVEARCSRQLRDIDHVFVQPLPVRLAAVILP